MFLWAFLTNELKIPSEEAARDHILNERVQVNSRIVTNPELRVKDLDFVVVTFVDGSYSGKSVWDEDRHTQVSY